MDGLNPSEMDIKVFIPAPTFCLLSKKVYSINGKRLHISFVRKNERGIQNAWLKYENNTIE